MLTATINITEPVTPAADYEIYYTLDKADGTDGDKFHEYEIGDEVIATLYLKNNSGMDTYLQAYDLYLTYDRNLTYTGTTIKGAEYKDGDSLTHIQAVGEDSEGVVLDKVEFKNGEEVALGTITFTINSDAVYDTQMPIALTTGTDSKIYTNIGVGGIVANGAAANGEGDSKSYYPVDISTVMGAEVMTTYTVTYDDGVEDEAITMPEAQTKEYNKPLTLSDTEPIREGWTFTGWLGNDSQSYVAGDTYETNADLVLTAQWRKNTVKVTWMNGDIQLAGPVDVDYNTVPSYNGTTPTKDPDAQYTYTFEGWTTDPDGTTAETLTAVTQDTTYYAVFSTTIKTYTVYWKNHDGTVLETDENVPYGTTPTYDSSVPTKEATAQYEYAFAGWTPDVSAVTGEATYTATYTESTRSYEVQFAAGTNGTLEDGDQQTIEYGGNLTTIPKVTAENGYKFTGWSDGTTTYTDLSSYTVSGPVTLTAQYELIEYTITLNANGGDALTSDSIAYKITDTVTLPSATKTGATFDGWKLETTVGGWEASTYSAGEYSGMYGTITLVAQWTDKSYTISIGSMTGGTVATDVNSANYGDSITLSNSPADGYEFVSYTVTDASGNAVEVKDGQFVMPDSAVTVSATFKAIDYTVTVDSNIQNGSVTAKDSEGAEASTANVGDKITLTENPDIGYKLKDYSVTYKTTVDGQEVSNSVTVTDGKFTMPAANVTVSAEFEGIAYKIQYNNNGGSGTMNATEAVYGTATTLAANIFTKTGYHFAGWATSADGTVVYTDQEEVNNLSDNGTVVVLYAVWEANTDTPYTVKHWQQNINGGTDQNDTNYTLKDTQNLTGTTASEVTPEVKSYDGFKAPTTQTVAIAPDGSTVVNYYYTRNSYSITLTPGEGASYGEGAVVPDDYVYGVGTTLPAPTKPGYSFDGWYDGEDKVDSITETDTGNKELTAQWSAIPYTITFALNGGAWPNGVSYTDNKLTYDIEETITLPTPEREYYTFGGWMVTIADGNWTANTLVNAGTVGNGKYGDVTLTAQWNRAATPVVQQYKYAFTGYWMLRVAANDMTESQEYRFNDAPMYYTTDSNYLLNADDTGVFYTLIPVTGTDGTVYIAEDALTDAGYELLKIADCDSRSTIVYDGDINGDNVVNIADANTVYQMTVSGGGYYSDTQLDIPARLKADMDTAINTGTEDHRGSIADVNSIVNKINGVAD